MSVWYCYLLRCVDSNGTESLYCGIAKDVQKRLAEHNAGMGAKYTRGRVCTLLAAIGPYHRRQAAYVENFVKSRNASEKLVMLRSLEKELTGG